MGCGSSHNPVVSSTGERPAPKDYKRVESRKSSSSSSSSSSASSIEAQKQGKSTSKDTKKDIDDIKLSFQECAALNPVTPEAMWAIVQKSSNQNKEWSVETVKNRRGWKTIRLFVSSTFRDFHAEREVLVKEIFPDLRLWCENRKLHLVECDLRWGVPKDTTTEETVKICLGELDRCYEDNVMPFFLNLTCNRCGWIPKFGDLTYNLAVQYGWVYGLSLTEMEIVHGAFRCCSPNSLFLIRDDEFTETLPDELKEAFVDQDPLYTTKLKKLKEMLADRFPDERIKHYRVKCSIPSNCIDERDVRLSGLSGKDTVFYKSVFQFFKERIEEQYPLDPTPEDPLEAQRNAHESFLDSRSQVVLGRDLILEELERYTTESNTKQAPILLIGNAGAGKSAIMAKIASDASKRQQFGQSDMRVFYHFVGAAPGSTDLPFLLQRLVKELGTKDVVSDLDALVQNTNSLLSNPNTPPTLIVIDAINQMDDDKIQYLNRWLPELLSPNVRVILSMIDGTECHYLLRQFRSTPREIICGELDKVSRQAIVENTLSLYNKRLDTAQMEVLLSKKGSANPLWLSLSCEELRVYGNFNTLDDKIASLSDDLIELQEQVLERFEEENGGDVIVATCCLLETSRHGLLETELLELLADTATLRPPAFNPDEDGLEITETEKDTKDVDQLAEKFHNVVDMTYVQKEEAKPTEEGVPTDEEQERLKALNADKKEKKFVPAAKWALVYRALKPLLRPCGDLGEGRLDFYHRSISKAVRRKYFSGSKEFVKFQYTFWHGKLATFFEEVDDMDRKSEELPYHLEQLLDNNRLIKCLLNWPVFERLFSEDFSIDLLRSWQKAGGYSPAANYYRESLKVLEDSDASLDEISSKKKKVIQFLIQAGQYKDAFELLEELQVIEEKKFKRPAELAEIYQMLAKTKSEVVKNHNFVTMSQLEEDKEVVLFCRKAIEHYKMIYPPNDEAEHDIALTQILFAHHIGIVADLDKTATTARQEAHSAIDAAISTFYRLNDLGHVAEAKMTKSFIDPRHQVYFQQKEKLLSEAYELCIKTLGEKHMLMLRLYLNTGILYEDNRDYNKAYDYFVKWNQTCLEVLGPSHPKSKRAQDTLEENTYVRIRQQRERQAAGTA